MPLGRRSDCGDAKFAGVELALPASDTETALQDVAACGFDFVATPLRRSSVFGDTVLSLQPLTYATALLAPVGRSGQIVGITSFCLEPDSPDRNIGQASAAALREELEWGMHLGLQACLLPLPPKLGNANFAQIINQVMGGLSNMALWLQIPLTSPSEPAVPSTGSNPADSAKEANSGSSKPAVANGHQPPQGSATHSPTGASLDSWAWWNQVRCMCAHQGQLGVALTLGAAVPSHSALQRWFGEPVRAIVVPTSIFQTNKRGFPALPKAHQAVLVSFFQLNVQVLLSDTERLLSMPEDLTSDSAFPSLSEASQRQPAASTSSSRDQQQQQQQQQHPLKPYWEYLSFLFRRQPEATPDQMLELSYRDYLQAPLQPLQDNLESATYETFEKDTTKYTVYQRAIHAALLDCTPQEGTEDIVVMVVGAGRGPLVTASLKAAHEAGRRVKVWAVEKNLNAIIHIQHLVVSHGWEDMVTIVAADMRHWEAPQQADILVSELLGSFGDNELSPECLDGAQKFLRQGGISIPQSYTSFLQPITTAKLWNDVKAYEDTEHYETPFVAKLHRFTPLADPQPVFTFSHPNTAQPIDNSRYCQLTFESTGESAICHGFAGYFDAVLYKQIHLSILPSTHTPNMASWFPIYFPIQQPVQIAASQDLAMGIWRCAANHKVWYEWCVTQPQCSAIHNPNGRSYFVGL
ncbi:Protein arginine N-methyltransferase 5 [Trebouxia sp. C0009 RCD-2024]